MKIYMDVCCLSRPFDNLSQPRIRLEAIAVTDILDRCRSDQWALAASEVLDFELSAIQDSEKMMRVREMYSLAKNWLPVTAPIKARAISLQSQGLSFFDSLHMALAEASSQDIFLTTDDKLLKRANKIDLNIRAANPVVWFMEVET
jgi:predicted nucleic acid-binding protein